MSERSDRSTARVNDARRRMKRFFARNALALASIVVAASSLFVAIISLRYSVEAQKEDAEYKELSIRPRLQVGAGSNFSVLLENVGLGPAQFQRIIFSDGDHCLDTDAVHDWPQADKFFDEFSNAIMNYVLVGMPASVDKKPLPIPKPKGFVPSTGIILKAGESLPLFSFDPNEMDAYVAALTKLTDKSAPDIIEKQFMHKGIKIPIYIRYCSLSGRFCDASGPQEIADGCQTKK
jgi:hypothetical protein